MPVPKYHELNRPLLELLADGECYTLGSAAEKIAQKLDLSAEDLAEVIPSGMMTRFLNRLGWAQSDLSRAGLTESVRRGVYRITDFGRAQLPSLPHVIDRAFLIRQGWGNWQRPKKIPNPSEPITSIANEDTPDERIDSAFGELTDALTEALLERLKKLSPRSFERFVVELLKAMNDGVGEVTGRTGDGGIDGVIYEDCLHLDRIYLQAKRWAAEQSVGAPDIDGFIGALTRQGATRGVFVTTSRYTGDAKKAADEVRNQRIRLIDGMELAELAIAYNVGVSVKRKLEIKRLDMDYFEELEEI
ncbi:MAG: restriction endonuclease [Zoogloeaceae bacterium]|jgi:restriction system protein|nr:restriction endonuclease [Zoogloeaceae bacterium]